MQPGAHQTPITTHELDPQATTPLDAVHHSQQSVHNTLSDLVSTLSSNNTVKYAQKTSGDTTQAEVHHIQSTDTNSDIAIVSEANSSRRHITVTETVMQKFLDKIGTIHFPEFDKYHPGLTLTNKGYVYDPNLLTTVQSKTARTSVSNRA